MNTEVLCIDPINPDPIIIKRAAEIVRAKKVIAFPTETVYGLGGVVFAGEVVDKIYEIKGRQRDKPLLVHISNIEQTKGVINYSNADMNRLMENFWPGPLSLVVSGGSDLPAGVRSKDNTVGLRMPSHPVALALIEATGPLAATSANISNHASPLSAAEVLKELDGKIELILDAGPTMVGIESTVLDLSVTPYKVLRLGGVKISDIKKVITGRIAD